MDALTAAPASATPPARDWTAAAAAGGHARRQRYATLALAVVGLLGGAVTGLGIRAVLPVDPTPIGIAYAFSVLAAVVGTYGVLLLLLLIARLPVLERALGQDRLVVAHRRIAPWATSLVGAHVVLVIASYAGMAGSGFWAQAWVFTTVEDILLAAIGTALMVAGAVLSWRRLRSRMRHEYWWALHLTMYLAVLLAFAHQISAGGPFLTGPARALWVGLYAAVFGAILWFRVLVPLRTSLRHRLRVERVVAEAPGTVSVWIRGRELDALGIAPGQFFNWRFDHPGLRFEAHPWTVSGMPVAVPGTREALVRITVKALGDSSQAVAQLPAGTRAFVEGPYGAVTPATAAGRRGSRVVLVAGGVGIAQVRTLAEAFAGRVPLDVIYRASSPEESALAGELRALARHPGVQLHLLPGSRREHPMNPDSLRALTGPLHNADVYLCGPRPLTDAASAAARRLGAARDRIHLETFDL